MLRVDLSGLSLLYAVLAGCCLLLASRLAQEIVVSTGALLRAAAALACMGLSIGAALVLIAAAFLFG